MSDSSERGMRPAGGPDASRGGGRGPKRVSPPASGKPVRAGNPRGDAGSKPSYDRSAGNPFSKRPAPDRGGRDRDMEDRDPYGIKSVRNRHDDPIIPDDVKAADLDRVARTQLKTLSKENAEEVARHLAMAARLIDDDPQLAHRHATSAARRAGRIAVVRESLAITAYAIGDFALALRELRTYRRISGNNDQLPLMVDSERGLGRPDKALELGRSVERAMLPVDVQVQLAIAMSGARLDLEQFELALSELEIPQLDPNMAFSWSADLFAAYGAVLEELGREGDAETWYTHADRASAALGHGQENDAYDVEIFEEEEAEVKELPGSEDPGESNTNESNTNDSNTKDSNTEESNTEDSNTEESGR